MADYGTVENLEAMWRPLSEAEKGTADELLAVTSAVFRSRVTNLDALIELNKVDAFLVDFAAQQVVKRVLMNPDGFKQKTESVGQVSRGGTLDQSIAGVNLYVSDADIRLFLPSYGASFGYGTIRVRPGLGMG